MTRLDVIFSEQADDDLASIYQWIAGETGSLETAFGYVDRIIDRCERLANAPHGGRNRDDLAPGLQTAPFEKTALIAYLVEGDAITVTNVFYKGRDVDAVFSPED